MISNNSIDVRNLSFRSRALYELKMENQRRLSGEKYWVLVQMANGKKSWFQLSKDLQKAMENEPFEVCQNYLVGSLINVPISKYKKEKAKIDCGKVCKLKVKSYRTSKPDRITRSQFKKPKLYKILGLKLVKTKELFNYLKHDYSSQDQQRIKRSIRNLVPNIYDIGGLIGSIMILFAIFLFVEILLKVCLS